MKQKKNEKTMAFGFDTLYTIQNITNAEQLTQLIQNGIELQFAPFHTVFDITTAKPDGFGFVAYGEEGVLGFIERNEGQLLVGPVTPLTDDEIHAYKSYQRIIVHVETL
jgi:hypothetical protein